jgi:hypothetical protein
MLLCGGPAHSPVEAAVCAYFIVNWKGIFHAGPVLIRDAGAAAEVRFAKTNLLHDMARSFRSNFPLASCKVFAPGGMVASKEGT